VLDAPSPGGTDPTSSGSRGPGSLESPAPRSPASGIPSAPLMQVTLPGWDPAELDVRVEGGHLVVEGHHEDSWDDEREGYRRMGRSSGHFVRRTPLPAGVDPAQVAAQLEGGVLTVRAGTGHAS